MQNPSKDKNAPGCRPRRDPHFAIMALSMKASTCFGAKLAAPQKTPVRARTAPVVSASLKEDVARFATAAGVGVASLGLALSANAASVKLGAAGGALVFEPAEVTIKSGETVTWTNNIGFPHNVVFDEDGIPAGASADKLSHEDYLNSPGETVSSTFDKPGEYSYYCEPHQGAGMAGKIIVQ